MLFDDIILLIDYIFISFFFDRDDVVNEQKNNYELILIYVLGNLYLRIQNIWWISLDLIEVFDYLIMCFFYIIYLKCMCYFMLVYVLYFLISVYMMIT